MTDDTRPPEDPITSDLVQADPSFEEIVLDFVDGLSERLKVMEEAVRASDFEALRVAAHRLKGTGGGYGYPILSERAAELERRAKRKKLNDCAKILTDLKSLCERVVVRQDE